MHQTLLNRSIVILGVLLALAGCGGTGKQLPRNRVSLADIQVTEMRTLETTFQAGLRILNPSETNLVIQGISCDLQVDGRHFASGLTSTRYEIPPYSSTIIKLPVYASTLDMVTSMLIRLQQADAGQSKPIHYELNGHLLVRQGDGPANRKLFFTAKGELTFDGNQQQ